MESNVWNLFENAIMERQGLIKGKKDSNETIKQFKEAGSVSTLMEGNSNILLLTQNALDLKNIHSDSVDYIFTDPPYGGEVQYFELSTLWCSWFDKKGRFMPDYDGEVTINKNQSKGFDFYHRMLGTAFSEMYRVLKGGKYLTVTFHNKKIKIFNSILKAASLAGFDLEKILYQPPARPSAKQLQQIYGSAVGDYYIRFQKPVSHRKEMPDERQIDKERYERIIIDCVKKVIAERGEPTPYSYIINSYTLINTELRNSGYLFTASDDIEKVLKKHKEIFIREPKVDSKGKTIGYLWWFKDPLSVPFIQRVPLSERVERTIIDVLNRDYQVTFDDILQEIFMNFPNALTPETSDIDNTLKTYAEQIKGGKWRLKPTISQRVSEHNQIIEKLCQLGEKAGYEVYGDISQRKKRIKFSQPYPNEIYDIDALWYNKSGIHYEFEVEHTTGITRAIVRGSYLSPPVKRIILFPEEQENQIYNRTKEPMLKEKIREDKWSFIRYDDFYRFYNKIKGKRKIVLSNFEGLYRMPSYTSGNLDTYI
jgi:hypothetical protein